jgi:hypothetical protein
MSKEIDFVSAFGEEVGTIMKNHLCAKKSRLDRLEAKQAAIKGIMELLDRDEATYESAIRTLEKKKICYAEIAKQIDSNRNEVAKQMGRISSDIGTIVPPHVVAEWVSIHDDLESESKLLALQQKVDDMMTSYVDMLKLANRQRAYFADLLTDYSLRPELDISHRVGAKKAKKGADEPVAPSASAPARVESPSSPSY